MASTKQDQGDPDTQGPINALKSKMELLTLKASLRYTTRQDFSSYNENEHVYVDRLRAVALAESESGGASALAANSAASGAGRGRASTASTSALARLIDLVDAPPPAIVNVAATPAPTKGHRNKMTSSSSTSSLRSAAKPHSNAASITASPALASAVKSAQPSLGGSQSMKSLSLGATAGAGVNIGGGIGSTNDKQGRFESDADFADRTRTVHSVRVMPGRAPPLALNAHGLLTVALERLQLPATQRAFFPRMFLFEDSLSLYLALFWYHFTKCFQSGADAATAESELLGVIAEFWSRVAAHARDTQPKPATGFPRPIFFDTFVQFFVFGISHAVHCGMVRVFPKSEATVATDFVRDRICAETYRLIGGYELAPATLRTMSERAFPTPIPIETIRALPTSFVLIPAPPVARSLSISVMQSNQIGSAVSPSIMRTVSSPSGLGNFGGDGGSGSSSGSGSDGHVNAGSMRRVSISASPASAGWDGVVRSGSPDALSVDGTGDGSSNPRSPVSAMRRTPSQSTVFNFAMGANQTGTSTASDQPLLPPLPNEPSSTQTGDDPTSAFSRAGSLPGSPTHGGTLSRGASSRRLSRSASLASGMGVGLDRPQSVSAPVTQTAVFQIVDAAVEKTPIELEFERERRAADSVLRTLPDEVKSTLGAGRAALEGLRVRPGVARLDSRGISPLTQQYLSATLGRTTAPSQVQFRLSSQSRKTQCGGSATVYAMYSNQQQHHYQHLVDETAQLRLKSNKDMALQQATLMRSQSAKQLLEATALAERRRVEAEEADPATQLRRTLVRSATDTSLPPIASATSTTSALLTLAPSHSTSTLGGASAGGTLGASASTPALAWAGERRSMPRPISADV